MHTKRITIGFICNACGAEPTYFLEFLNSLLLQAHTDWDLQLAIRSPDLARMEGILQDYESKDTRLKVIRFKPDDEEINLSRLAAHSQADFVMAIDKHAYLAHDALLRIVSMLQDKPHLERIVGEQGTFNTRGAFVHDFSEDNKALLAHIRLFEDGKDGWTTPLDLSRIGIIPAALVYARVDALA